MRESATKLNTSSTRGIYDYVCLESYHVEILEGMLVKKISKVTTVKAVNAKRVRPA